MSKVFGVIDTRLFCESSKSSAVVGTHFAWHFLGLVFRGPKARADASAKQIECPSRRWDSPNQTTCPRATYPALLHQALASSSLVISRRCKLS